jgi:hypothetical protein
MRRRVAGLALVLIAASCGPLRAQEGARSGAVPVSRARPRPDLSGYWNVKGGSPSWDPADPQGNHPGALAMTPWAREKLEAARPPFGANATYDQVTDPVQRYCDPAGITRLYQYPYEFMFLQTPDAVYVLYEFSRVWRLIPLNQPHSKDPDPTWMGESVGKYEADSLVVDTIGFNDKTWIDQLGHPHSDALHLVERFRRLDNDTLELDVTFDDPKAYTKPFTVKRTFTRSPSPPTEALCSLSEMQSFQNEVMKPTVPSPHK